MQFSRLYRRPKGPFLSYPHKDKIEKILSNPRFNDVEVIVVSDGERILGLGDQGAGGMGIPIGKLFLYTACADIGGTNNPEIIDDPAYIGWRQANQ
jgi:malate dehydrogenase (oxaloacetate-decarboxylating)